MGARLDYRTAVPVDGAIDALATAEEAGRVTSGTRNKRWLQQLLAAFALVAFNAKEAGERATVEQQEGRKWHENRGS